MACCSVPSSLTRTNLARLASLLTSPNSDTSPPGRRVRSAAPWLASALPVSPLPPLCCHCCCCHEWRGSIESTRGVIEVWVRGAPLQGLFDQGWRARTQDFRRVGFGNGKVGQGLAHRKLNVCARTVQAHDAFEWDKHVAWTIVSLFFDMMERLTRHMQAASCRLLVG